MLERQDLPAECCKQLNIIPGGKWQQSTSEGKGQYEVEIRINGYPRQRATFGTRAEAIAWATKIEAQMNAGSFVEVRETRCLLLHDLILRYKSEIATLKADSVEKCRITDEIDRKFGQYGVLNLTAREIVVKEHLEVAQIRFHDTSREATTRLPKKLPNVVELAAVTGHKKLDMLRRYYQPDPSELAKKLD